MVETFTVPVVTTGAIVAVVVVVLVLVVVEGVVVVVCGTAVQEFWVSGIRGKRT
jgi:hypothetical protein